MAFRGFLKLSTQVTKTVMLIDSTDHVTGKTGLTITKYLTKAGGTPTSATMTTSELDSTNTKGLYSLVFTTSHTDTLGEFALHCSGTGADPMDDWWEVVTYLPGEAALLQTGSGTGQLDFTSGVVKANATQILGTAVSTPATAGILDVNVKNIDNDAASASGTVTFPNATLASTTNITAGTITTATNVTTVNGLAAAVITASSIAADAITAAKLAADVTTEIQSGLATAPTNWSSLSIDTNGRVDVIKVAGTSQTAGDIMSKLDATVSSRIAASTSLTEGYAADGAAPTLQQILFMILQNLQEVSISGTTLTVKKLDGSTTAMTFTLDSALAPTSRTRTT